MEISEALKQQFEEEVLSVEREKHKKELEELRLNVEAKVKEELSGKSDLEIKELKVQIEEKAKKLEEAQKQELDLRRDKNRLEEEKRTFELEKQRQIDAERERIREKTLSEFVQSQRLKDKEKDKMIEDLKKSLEDAQRRANQGSQQLQGEVQELDLEETLRTNFPTDLIEPVEKGIRGADVRQIVKTSRGNICGVILWESKRTKAWDKDWIRILKDNLRAEKANIPIIVSSILPDEAKDGMGFKDGVWICGYQLILPLADLIRQRLIEIAREKYISQNKGGKAEAVYEYVTSHEFIQQVEAIAEVYQDMLSQVLRERAAFEKIWKTREAQVEKLFKSTAGILGSLRGQIGSTLPQIKGLDLPELTERT